MSSVSPIALLHPTAPPARAVVLGDGCPPAFAPGDAFDRGRGSLVVVAPSAAESRLRTWLPEALAAAAERLDERGIVVVWGRHAVRSRAERLGERHGLVRGVTAAAVPGRQVLVAPARVSFLLSGALVLCREGSPGPLAWLDADATRGFSIRRSPRSGAVLVAVDGVRAKVSAQAQLEHERLEALAPDARRAGALVPESRFVHAGDADALVQSALPGRPASTQLMRRRARPADILEPLARWLTEWAVQTRRPRRLGETAAFAELLVDTELLASRLGDERTLRLRAWCDELVDEELPIVAAHRDLTMWNVLPSDDGPAIVDWESATDDALPLVDLEYACVDAFAASRRYRSRVAAFDEAGSHLQRLRERMSAALALPEHLQALARHACWLHHAANEQRRPESDARPFLEIALRLDLP